MSAASARPSEPTAIGVPMDSIRNYVQALEARGRLLRLPQMDQDQFEITAFAYRLLDRVRPGGGAGVSRRTRQNRRHVA